MTAFPALIPSSRTFTPGDRAHALLRSMGGRSTQVRHSNVVTGQQLQLVFIALSEANMLAVQMHYINRRGQFGTFSLPSAIWSGSTDRTISGYSWRYVGMPKVDEPFCGRFTVSLTLEMLAEYAPPAATGDTYVLIPRAAVTVAALVPVVSGNASVSVAIPAAGVTVEGLAFVVQGATIVQIPAAAVTVAGLVPTVESATSIIVAIPSVDVVVEALVFVVQGAAVVEIPLADVVVAALTPLVDGDANSYIAAVESADGQSLEADVASAYREFIVGCKTDGIWTAIKAACILAGARTLTGALVPLVGTAPTNVDGLFVAGDYNRETGLVRSASTKYLNSNRLQSADPQNNHHLAIWKSDSTNEDAYFIGSGGGSDNYTLVGRAFMYSRTIASGISDTGTAASSPAGLWGVSRTSSTSVQYKRGATAATTTTTEASLTNLSLNHFVCTWNSNGTADSRGSSRFAFYSIGESLDLALLDARVTTLVNAIAAAIP